MGGQARVDDRGCGAVEGGRAALIQPWHGWLLEAASHCLAWLREHVDLWIQKMVTMAHVGDEGVVLFSLHMAVELQKNQEPGMERVLSQFLLCTTANGYLKKMNGLNGF